MVAAEIIAILLGLHIFSVTGWLGSSLLFELIISPTIPRLSPQLRGELTSRLFPKISIFLAVFGGLTIIFGLLLALAISNGDLGVFGLGNSFGLRIDIGATLGLLSAIIGGGLTRRTAMRLVELTNRAASNPQHAHISEIPALEERLRRAGLISLFLLVFALVFMVAAASGV